MHDGQDPKPVIVESANSAFVATSEGRFPVTLDPEAQAELHGILEPVADAQSEPPTCPVDVDLDALEPDALLVEVTREVLIRMLQAATTPSLPGPPAWRAPDCPRRKWDAPFPAIFPSGASRSWVREFVQHMFLTRWKAVSVAVPEEILLTGIRSGWYGGLMKGLVLRGAARTGGSDTEGARRLLARRYEYGFAKPPAVDLPEEEQNTTRFVHELLNGMAPAALLRTDVEGRYRLSYRFTDLPFGDPHPGRPADLYKLPDVDVDIVVEGDTPRVDEVRLRYRRTEDPAAYAQGGESAYGPWTSVRMRDPSTPLWRRSAARRIVMGVLLLAGQLDGHVALGHLATEWASVALDLSGMSSAHPVRRILAPRLAEVSAVNRFADDAIWGESNLFATCTALTGAALQRRMMERLSAMDWKGWRPRAACVAPSHYAPKVLSTYYDSVVLPYVRDALGWIAGAPAGQRLPWFQAGAEREEMLAFFQRIAEPAVMHAPWDGQPRDAWLDPSEFVAKPPGSRAFTLGRSEDDVIELVAFILFNATLGHSWPNVRQVQTAGDPDFGTPSLKLGLDEGPQSDAWHAAASPIAADAVFMMLTADILTHLDVDTFGKELRLSQDERHELADPSEVPRDPYLEEEPGCALAARFVAADLGRFVQGPYQDPIVASPDIQLSRCNR